MKKNNSIFFITFITIIFIGSITYIRNQKEISYNENRTLNKFPHLTINNYLSGIYQKELESAFADQFWGSEKIKENYNELFDSIKIINKNKKLCKNNYYSIGQRSVFDCSDYIVFKPSHYDAKAKKQFLKILNSYSKLNNYIDTYYYFINTSIVFDFRKNNYSIDTKKIYKENMKGKYNYSELTFKNYDEYKKYFYKTDHHWNYKGSYKGYKDIMKMFNINDINIPISKKKFNGYYYFGSHASVTRKYNFHEEFTAYKFNFPNHKTYINGLPKEYGKQSEYFSNKIKYSKNLGLYGDFYGWDYGEIIFDFNNKNKNNLLIIGNSYTNAINMLIASHFNRTYIIDLRNYEHDMNKKFDIINYIKDNNIDKVLVISDNSFYSTNEFQLNWRDK